MKGSRSIALLAALIMVGCSSRAPSSNNIDGKYAGPGATLEIDGDSYHFCEGGDTCSQGRVTIRQLASNAGRITFHGRHISQYVRAKAGRSLKEDVELSYKLGALGGAYISIHPRTNLYFRK